MKPIPILAMLTVLFLFVEGWPVGVVVLIVTVAFTGFDLTFFPFTHDYEKWLPVYRVAQGLVQTGLYYWAFTLSGWTAPVASFIIWWTGGCDILYYLMGNFPWHFGPWYWLWWTPAGLVEFLPAWRHTTADKARLAVTMPLNAVLWQAGIGLTASTILVIIQPI